MEMKVSFICLVLALINTVANSAKIDGKDKKPINTNGNDKPVKILKPFKEPTIDKSDALKKLTEIIDFLSPILKDLQSQLNSQQIQSNSILAPILSNPALTGFVSTILQNIKLPLAEANTIIIDIETLIPISNQGEALNALPDLIDRLVKKIGSFISVILLPIPGYEGISTVFENFVKAFVMKLEQLSSSLRGRNTTSRTSSLSGLCGFLQGLPGGSLTESLSDLSGITSLFPLKSGFISQLLQFITHIFLPSTQTELQNNHNSTNFRFEIPLQTEKVSDFIQYSYGLADNNKLVLTNIITGDITLRNPKSLKSELSDRSIFHQMSLFSLQSMMQSLVNDMKDGTQQKYVNSLNCQLDVVRCTLSNKDNDNELQNCVKTFPTCIGKEQKGVFM